MDTDKINTDKISNKKNDKEEQLNTNSIVNYFTKIFNQLKKLVD